MDVCEFLELFGFRGDEEQEGEALLKLKGTEGRERERERGWLFSDESYGGALVLLALLLAIVATY